jgi:periplasmic divalent cation tolerance protein
MTSATTLVYVTAGSRDEAVSIGRALVEARLAACANILPPITSIYRWDDAIQEDEEVGFIVKTRAELVPAVTARVSELHSYDCPCVVAMPITDGNPYFLDWIMKETA